MGTKGTNGVLNDLGASGIFLRIIRFPKQTKENAKKVPMLTICTKSLIGINPSNSITKNKKKLRMEM